MECPQNMVQQGVPDTAYGGGVLTLSVFSQAVASSGCSKCYLGTISAGSASGPGSKERALLHAKLAAVPGMLPAQEWSGPVPVISPLVQSCPDRTKQNAVPGVLAWYQQMGIYISASEVYFFDDRADNVLAFRGRPYNAKQISCASRDLALGGTIGLCGATLDEIVLEKGIKTCADSSVVA